MGELANWYKSHDIIPGTSMCPFCEIYANKCIGCPSNAIHNADQGCIKHSTIPTYQNTENSGIPFTKLSKIRGIFWEKMHLTAKKLTCEYFQPSKANKHREFWCKLIESTEKELLREFY